MAELQLDSHKTALVLIDLQNAIVGMSTAPHPAPQVVANSAKLAEAFRGHGAPVVYVRVDLNDFLELPVDQPFNLGDKPLPAAASEITPSAGFQPGDILVTKRHWGAFAGTDLEQQLKSADRHGRPHRHLPPMLASSPPRVRVPAWALPSCSSRDAYSSQNAEHHRFAFENIFPRLTRVRSTDEVLASLA